MRRAPAVMLIASAAACLVMAASRPAAAQWQIESKDGKASLKFGFLAQPEFEALETPDTTGTSKNVFLRRLRILFGGKISDRWTFFVETDSPNLGKGALDATGTKDSGNIYIQDAYFTFTYNSYFMVDAGMILVPLSHNHNQSAATLLPVDYGPYTFTESTPLGSRVGRDYGGQVRGYPLGHFEYRLGVFQGVRGPQSTNSPRFAGRVVWYPFALDNGFFYGGTWQGSKRVVAVGAGFDKQKEYHSFAFDAFVEEPLNGGQQGITAQVNWVRFDGGTFLATLPKQDALLIEAGVHLFKGRLTPVAQFSRKTFDDPLRPTQHIWQAGAAWWMKGHQRNIKVTAGRQHTNGLPDRTQVLAQLQLFYF